jgi:hypothetical protein
MNVPPLAPPHPGRRFLLLTLALLGILLAIAFRNVLFRGEQFGYRDAAHFYYPLYLKVQQEWAEGHLPLWEPEENAGMPLLGNPTAAVLYPGKLLFAVLPYPWAYRLYTVLHTALCYATLFAFARGLGVGRAGSTIAALGYAFGAPVLFQYCNIIFLVGAAWAPLGFLGAHQWVMQGRRIGLFNLAIALAMEVLGGDPQMAYLTGLCAALLVFLRKPSRPIRWWIGGPLAFLAAAAWVGATLWLAAKIPGWRPSSSNPEIPAAWFPESRGVIAGAWGIAGAIALWRLWRGRGAEGERKRMAFFGLIVAGILGGLVASVQLLPSLEFTSLTLRAAREGPHDIYPFSVEPYRLVELAWPNFFGTMFGGAGHWLGMLPPVGGHEIWVPSLYIGAGTLVLAWAGIRWSRDGSAAPWLTWLALISAVGSLGEFTGPLWWARWTEAGVKQYGPHDPTDVTPIRKDGQLRDGDGGFYWALSTFAPGFGQFRYPAKLFTITGLCLSVLAGIGWDRLRAGPRLRFLIPAGLLLAATGTALALSWAQEGRVLAWLETAKEMGSALGAPDVPEMLAELRIHLLHGGVALAAMIAAVVLAHRRARFAGGIAVIALAADLLLANGPLIYTVPQSIFEASPKVADLIGADAREHPFEGPFRVHRVPIWNPVSWIFDRATDRVREMTEWERQTIQPKYGINLGIEYTKTEGTAELYDYSFFFGGFTRRIREEAASKISHLGLQAGDQVIYMPRKSFDLWNTRYFILPAMTNWKDEHRGVLSFLTDCDVVYPEPGTFDGPGGEERREHWQQVEDFQILRNRAAYPRAWIVRKTRRIDQSLRGGLDRTSRSGPITEMMYANDWLWNDPNLILFDPKEQAWVEPEDYPEVVRRFGIGGGGEGESVRVAGRSSRRVELAVEVKGTPALVILSDVYYAGWKLFLDGEEVPILRVNRMMRGAIVPPGTHRLVYVYEPASVRLGAGLSLVGLLGLGGLGIAAIRGRRLIDRAHDRPVR